MARTCTVCAHPEREDIDQALVSDSSNLSLSAEFGVTESALRRHKRNHLPASLVKSQEAREVAASDDLLAQVRGLQERTLAILETAEDTRQHRTALSAIKEARSNLELLGKLAGELDDSPTVNVLLSPQWLQVRTAIVEVLSPYPDARSAVAGKLLELEEAS